MELREGQVVTSRRGRDVTRAYMVVKIEGDRVLLADGGKRPLSAPKPKNIRHIQPTGTFLSAGQSDTDQKLKEALAPFQRPASATSGG